MNFSFLSILPVIIGAVWAVVFWKAADLDGQSRFLWTGLSIGVFLLTWWILGWGWIGIMLAQVALGIAIAVVRALLSLRPAK